MSPRLNVRVDCNIRTLSAHAINRISLEVANFDGLDRFGRPGQHAVSGFYEVMEKSLRQHETRILQKAGFYHYGAGPDLTRDFAEYEAKGLMSLELTLNNCLFQDKMFDSRPHIDLVYFPLTDTFDYRMRVAARNPRRPDYQETALCSVATAEPLYNKGLVPQIAGSVPTLIQEAVRKWAQDSIPYYQSLGLKPHLIDGKFRGVFRPVVKGT